MLKHQSRPTSKIKINSKDSITTTTMENRQTTTTEKRESITATTGKTEKRFTGW